MTSESLAYYLDNTGRLYELNAQELQVMVDTFPYCQNLRYLLLKKSQLDNTSSFDHLLQLAAAYSTDRPFLYQLINERNFYQHTLLEEDVLILNNVPATSETPILDLSSLDEATKEALILENTVIAQPEPNSLAIEQTEVPQASNPNIETQNPKLETQNLELEDDDDNELTTFEDLLQAEGLEDAPTETIADYELETQNSKLVEEDDDDDELTTFEDLLQAEELEDAPTETIADYKLETQHSKLVEEDDDDELTTFEDLIQAEGLEDAPTESIADYKLETQHSKPVEDDDDELTTFEDLIQAEELEDTPTETIAETQNSAHQTPNAKLETQNLSNTGIIFEIVEPLGIENANAIADTAPAVVAPMPKTSFSSWLKKFHSPYTATEEIATPHQKGQQKIEEEVTKEAYKTSNAEERVEIELEKKRLKEDKKKKKEALVAFADESLKRRDDIFSETLAKILGAQGYNSRAIEMYEKLKLIFPEKSPYFAAQIEKLKSPPVLPKKGQTT